MFKSIFNKNQLTIDLICGFYILFLASFVRDITEAVVYGWKSATNASILGIIILLMNALDAYAIATKINLVFQSIENKEAKYKMTSSFFLLFMIHAVVTLLSIVMAFNMFGYNPEKYPIVIYFGVGLLFVKEFYFFKSISIDNKIRVSDNKNLFLNLVIALYSCLIFSIFWNSNNSQLHVNNTPLLMLELFAAGIFFSFFYFALRIPFLINRLAKQETILEKYSFYISFLVALLPALIRLVYK